MRRTTKECSMSTQRSPHWFVASAIALTLLGMASVTMAQTASSQQFYPGTQSSATYSLPGSHGGTLTVVSGMPARTRDYGPPPPFASLDVNRDGRISEAEAQAYPPLDSDFLYASGGGKSISRAQYTRWAKTQQ
jgi:hypothetical protein